MAACVIAGPTNAPENDGVMVISEEEAMMPPRVTLAETLTLAVWLICKAQSPYPRRLLLAGGVYLCSLVLAADGATVKIFHRWVGTSRTRQGFLRSLRSTTRGDPHEGTL